MPKPNKSASAERLQFVEPMYAQAVQQLPEGKDWVYEVKFDGYRCLAGKDSTGVTLWSRRGNRFTSQFPTIGNACEHLPPDTLLDGEIIALDQNGRVSFNQLQHHRSQAQTTLFYAFDVIIHRGRRLIHLPLETRREALSDIVADLKTRTPLLGLSDTLDATPAELIPLVKEFGFEGIVAKRKDSCYEIGKRSGAWLKYKVNKAQEFVIGGYTPDNPLDALIVGYYEGDKLIFVSKVRNGFVPRLRREVWAKLKHLQTDACPFANLPEKRRTQWALTREEMKNCIWLKPEMVAQFESTEWTPDGHLVIQSSAVSETIKTRVRSARDRTPSRLLIMLDEKSKGKEVTIAPPAPQRGGKVVDIMEALKRSMERIPAKKKPASTAAAKKKRTFPKFIAHLTASSS